MMTGAEAKATENREKERESKFVEMLAERPVTLIDLFSKISIPELKDKFLGKKIFACDFAVDEIDSGESVPGGYVSDDITNIDHHAKTDRMARKVSSGVLAIEYMKKGSVVSDKENVVVVNHTDCDSVISSAIMRGILPPDPRFGKAVVAADHTGEPNEIADLLQAIQEDRDLEFSLRNLEYLLDGKPLEPRAQELLKARLDDRERAKKIIESGQFKSEGDVYFVMLDKRIDGELLPALMPEASAILLASPMKEDPSKLEVKVRLGVKAPDGFYLNQQDLPNFGGRWNAGNTKRSGGTPLSVEEYAKVVNKKLEDFSIKNK